MKILYIIPDSFLIREYFYHGSNKDINCRLEYFKNRGLDYDQMIVDRKDKNIQDKLSLIDLKIYSHFFFEFPHYSESVKYIKKIVPTAKIFCRSNNADFFHDMHILWLNIKALRHPQKTFRKDIRKILRLIQEDIFRLKQNILCAKNANAILPITEWESQYYWKFLAGDKVKTIPYYLPAQYVDEIRSYPKNKQNICVGFLGVKVKNKSFLEDSLINFCRIVELIGNDCPEWGFKLTGGLKIKAFSFPKRIELTGCLETPYPLLAESRAIAILSDFGFGFKTKVLEAIISGCYVILPKSLYNRMPEVVKPFCIVVNLHSIDSFKNALTQTLRPFPKEDPNTLLKNVAFGNLDSLFY